MAGTIMYNDMQFYPGIFLELNPLDLPVTTLLMAKGIELIPQKEYTYTFHSHPDQLSVTPTLQTDLGTVNYGSTGFTTGSNVLNVWFEGAAVSWARQNDQNLGRVLNWQGPGNQSRENDPLSRAITDALTRIKTQLEYVAREGVYFNNGAGTGTWQQRGYRKAPGITNATCTGAVAGGSAVGSLGTLTDNDVKSTLQTLWSNKINASDELTMFTNARGLKSLGSIFTNLYKTGLTSGPGITRAGVNITQFQTEFGMVNIVPTHSVPLDQIYILNLNGMRALGHIAVGGQLIYESPTLPPGVAGTGVGLYTEMGVDHGHGSMHARIYGVGTSPTHITTGTIEST